MSEPTCPCCGVPFTEHDGLTSVCRKYRELQEEIARIAKLARGRVADELKRLATQT